MTNTPTIQLHSPSLEAQHQEILNRCSGYNARQDNPFGLPVGFFKVLSWRGESRGFGFYCPKCKLHVPGYAGREVRHCGTTSALPTGRFAWLKILRLKTYRLSQRA